MEELQKNMQNCIVYYESANIQKADLMFQCSSCRTTYFSRKLEKTGNISILDSHFCPSCGQPGGRRLTQDDFLKMIGEK